MAPSTSPQTEVVAKVTYPYGGAARALHSQAKQLCSHVYALKQYIYYIRLASKIAIKGHDDASAHLRLPSCLLTNPSDSVNSLFAPDGLQSLIDELANCEQQLAETYRLLYPPDISFRTEIELLNAELDEIGQLLSKDRLGRTQQRNEDHLVQTAEEVSRLIAQLNTACVTPLNPAIPRLDAFVLHYNARLKLNSYLLMEQKYNTSCLHEQNAHQKLEEKVFAIMQDIPVAHEMIMSQVMDRCNEILSKVDLHDDFHSLTDWTAFENRNLDEFVPESLKFITNNKMNSRCEYQVIRLDDIEIYHKLKSAEEHQQSTDREGKCRRIRNSMTMPKYIYGVRGAWSVSTAGNLIEYDEKQCRLHSMFNLRKCSLGTMSYDKNGLVGYFTLRGQKLNGLLDPSDKKKKRTKKEYKFRGTTDRIRELYKVLTKYCMDSHRTQAEHAEGSTMSDETVANSDVQPMEV